MTRLILTATILFVSAPAFAHNHRFFGKCPSCDATTPTAITIEELPAGEVELKESDLKALYNSAKGSMETVSADSSYWRELKDQFNLKQVALNALRWYGMNRARPEVANVAANITLMLLASHTFETVGGLGSSAYVALHPDLNPILRTVVGIGGVAIAVPGLDIVCIALGYSYYKYPKAMNRALEKPRVFLVKGLRAANAAAGLPPGYWSNKLNEKLRQRMRAKLEDSFVDFETIESGYRVHMQTPDGRDVVNFEFQATGPGKMGLTALEIANASSEEYRLELKHAASVFGFNVAGWSNQILAAKRKGQPQILRELSYVRDVEQLEDRLRVTTNPDAFTLPDACADLLAGT